MEVSFFVFLTIVFLVSGFADYCYGKKEHNISVRVKALSVFIFRSVFYPFVSLAAINGIWLVAYIISHYFSLTFPDRYSVIFFSAGKTIELIIVFWFFVNIYSNAKKQLLSWLLSTHQTQFHKIMITAGHALHALIILLMLMALIPKLGLMGSREEFVLKIAKFFAIMMVGWIIIQCVNSIEEIILKYISSHRTPDMTDRKLTTQTLLLKKIFIALISIVTLSVGLMVFDSARLVGTGLLTTAGLIGAVGAVAAQQSLNRLFTGLQFAFTQPIRMGDTVIIEKEMGYVEEITLSYVVIKLWDLRRLVLPTNYFFSHGIQNLSRQSTELLGTIYFYADYTLPVAIIRKKFLYFLARSIYWDKTVGLLQVTDMKENTMELRALVSAVDASTLWDLQCDIREKLMTFIVKKYPHCLPVKRSVDLSTDDRIST